MYARIDVRSKVHPDDAKRFFSFLTIGREVEGKRWTLNGGKVVVHDLKNILTHILVR